MIDKNVFTDKVKIKIKSGDGGDGMNSFKSYKGKPACGPDGGDGGKGGDIYIVADRGMNDLLSFRFTSKYFAENGEKGGTNQCFGRGGKDVIIKVPVGTVVKDFETGAVIADMFADGEKKLIAEGGRGGKGNVRFTTSRTRPQLCPEGRKNRAARSPSRTQSNCRRRHNRLPQRGQKHAAFKNFRRPPQGGELSLHHAFTQSRRRARLR